MTMAATPTPPRESHRRRLTTTDLALIAAFAALIAACAYLGGIPVGGAGVEITLQTFGVLLAGAVLGPVRGFLAVGALPRARAPSGCRSSPAHSAGLGVFTGISAGYLWSLPAGGPARRPAGRAAARRAGHDPRDLGLRLRARRQRRCSSTSSASPA